MNEEKQFDKIMMVNNYFLSLLEDFESNMYFKHNLLRWGNKFKKELKKTQDMHVALTDLYEQSHELNHKNSIHVENIINCMFNLNDNQSNYFEKDFKELMNKYNLIENE